MLNKASRVSCRNYTHTNIQTNEMSGESALTSVDTLIQKHTHTTDLDHLLAINDFEFLQVFFEEFRSSPPLEQPQ